MSEYCPNALFEKDDLLSRDAMDLRQKLATKALGDYNMLPEGSEERKALANYVAFSCRRHVEYVRMAQNRFERLCWYYRKVRESASLPEQFQIESEIDGALRDWKLVHGTHRDIESVTGDRAILDEPPVKAITFEGLA